MSTDRKLPVNEKNAESKLRTFSTGSTRSRDVEFWAFNLMSPIARRREAAVYAEGARVHGPRNWENGDVEFVDACLNHLEYHLNLYKAGDRKEDHLAKIAVNAGFIMHLTEMDELRNPLVVAGRVGADRNPHLR